MDTLQPVVQESPRILIASDSFKGSLSAVEACAAIAAGVCEALPGARVDSMPVSDGGEGFLQSLLPQLEGAEVLELPLQADNPPIALLHGGIAYLESAQTLGLYLPHNANTPITERFSWGLGEQLCSALDRLEENSGAHALDLGTVAIGLGGSATNDGGLGLLQALGVRCCIQSGDCVAVRSIYEYNQVTSLDFSRVDPRLSQVSLRVLVDVDNPLLGTRGATATFGPQKGVHSVLQPRFEHFLGKFAAHVREATGTNRESMAGAGAAGGLGFAFAALGAEVRSGADFVLELLDFKDKIQGYDAIISGEGRSDRQTLQGKIPCKVARVAKEAGVPVFLLSGQIDPVAVSLLKTEFDGMDQIMSNGLDPLLAMSQAQQQLQALSARFIGRISAAVFGGA